MWSENKSAVWCYSSILIDMNKVIKESREMIIDKTAKYLHWLTIPKSEFGNMPVCPFLEKEMRDDMLYIDCLLYTSPSPRDLSTSRMPSSA